MTFMGGSFFKVSSSQKHGLNKIKLLVKIRLAPLYACIYMTYPITQQKTGMVAQIEGFGRRDENDVLKHILKHLLKISYFDLKSFV
jgi:hypothetical protein